MAEMADTAALREENAELRAKLRVQTQLADGRLDRLTSLREANAKLKGEVKVEPEGKVEPEVESERT